VSSQRFCITKGISVVFLIFLYGVLSLVHGQQTIFNVPTTDVLDKGEVYAELDASLKPTVIGYTGYSIGNQNLSNGNQFFLLELGYNFN